MAAQNPPRRRRANAIAVDDLAAAPPLPNFSLTPYTAVQGIIHFSTADGRKLYERATAPLSNDPFDCQPDKLRSFLENLSRRAQAFGWSDDGVGITQIPDDLDNLAETTYTDLIRNYGQISISHIRANELTYINTRTRAAEDTTMLYHCIMNSITSEAMDVVTIWKHDYMIQDKPSGTLLLKVILRESHIDTNATEASIRTKLSNLDQNMSTINNDISKFNAYVRHLQLSLAARGAQSGDLLSNLFKGYLACSDRIFVRYIEKKQEDYEEGNNVTPNELMLLAKTRYDVIREKGLWNALSPEQKEILALKAQVNGLSKKQQSNHQENKQNKDRDNTRRKPKLPKWIFQEPPKDTLQKPKTWKDFQWFWCGKSTGGKCERYRQHQGSECKGLARSVTNPTTKPTANPTTKIKKEPTKRKETPTTTTSADNPNKKQRFAKALKAAASSNLVDDDEISI